MKILIVDYGSAHPGRLVRAFEQAGVEAELRSHPSSLASFSRVVLPGGGTPAETLARLARVGWIEPLRRAALEERKPLLGIELGMLLLGDDGLGLVPGSVQPLTGPVPWHCGWSETDRFKEHGLLDRIPAKTDFYFRHRHAFVPADPGDRRATVEIGGRAMTAAVSRGPVHGVLFFPEKSGAAGIAVLRHFALGEAAP